MGSRHPALHGSNPVPVADECTSQTARHVRSGHPHHHHGKEPYAAVQCRSELLGRKAERRPKLTWSPRNAGPAPLPNGVGQLGYRLAVQTQSEGEFVGQAAFDAPSSSVTIRLAARETAISGAPGDGAVNVSLPTINEPRRP